MMLSLLGKIGSRLGLPLVVMADNVPLASAPVAAPPRPDFRDARDYLACKLWLNLIIGRTLAISLIDDALRRNSVPLSG